MMELQSAICIHQIQRVDRYFARRKQIWERYDKAFADLPVICPALEEPETVHARHLYTLLLDIDRTTMTRDSVQQKLYEDNIGTGIHYISLHLHDYYRKTYGYKPDDFHNAKFISDRTLSLPLSAKLSDEDVEDVLHAIRKIVAK